MKRLTLALLFGGIAACAVAKDAWPQISGLKGRVYYKHGEEWLPAKVGTEFGTGTRLKTEAGAWVHLSFGYPRESHRCVDADTEVYFGLKNEATPKCLVVMRGRVSNLNTSWGHLARKGEAHYFAACILTDAGNIQLRGEKGGWTRVRGHHDVYAGMRLRTGAKSKATIRASSGEVARVLPNSEFEVPLNKPWPALKDLVIRRGRIVKSTR